MYKTRSWLTLHQALKSRFLCSFDFVMTNSISKSTFGRIFTEIWEKLKDFAYGILIKIAQIVYFSVSCKVFGVNMAKPLDVLKVTKAHPKIRHSLLYTNQTNTQTIRCLLEQISVFLVSKILIHFTFGYWIE